QSRRIIRPAKRRKRYDTLRSRHFVFRTRSSVPINRSSPFVSHPPKGRRCRGKDRDRQTVIRPLLCRILARPLCQQLGGAFRKDACRCYAVRADVLVLRQFLLILSILSSFSCRN